MSVSIVANARDRCSASGAVFSHPRAVRVNESHVSAAPLLQQRRVWAWSVAPQARLIPSLSAGRSLDGQRSDFVNASNEFQQLCEHQIRSLSEFFAHKGELVASIYMRLPGSLRHGVLELQRVCWTPQGERARAASHDAILIGGPGSNLTEERVTAQSTLSLPGRGHIVLPLVSSPSSFLVGLVVLEGFNRAARPTSTAAPASGPPWSAQKTLPRVLPPPARPTELPSVRQASAATSTGANQRESAPAFAPAKDVLAEPKAMRLLLLTAGVLSAACAMELRSVLLAATQAAREREMAAALEEICESTAAMRTLGHLLRPRLASESVESSVADAMLTQGAHVAALAHELEAALQPLSSQHPAYPSIGPVASAGGATQQPAAAVSPLETLFPAAPSPTPSDPLLPLCGSTAASPASATETALMQPQSCRGGSWDPCIAASAEQRDWSASDNSRGARDVAGGSQWMVLRSIDCSEEAGLMSEGDALSFGESDDWRPDAVEPVGLLPRPVRRQVVGEAAVAAEHECTRGTGGGAALDYGSTASSGEAVWVAGTLGDQVCVAEAAARSPGNGKALQRRRSGGAERPGPVAVVPQPPMRLCNVLDVVGQALVPVKKLCDSVGVEVVMLSSALMAHMDGVMGRRKKAAAVERRVAQEMMMHAVSADSASRAISHVLDSSLQRVAKRGRVLVDVVREDGAEGAAARVRVMIADTGVAMWGRSAVDWGGGAGSARSAQDAIQRFTQGKAVGNGEMALHIAEKFVQESGGALTVGRWSYEDAEYVRTTITFRGM